MGSTPLLRQQRQIHFRKPQPLLRRSVTLHIMRSTMGHRAVDMFRGGMFLRSAITGVAITTADTMGRQGAITEGGTMGHRSGALHQEAITATD